MSCISLSLSLSNSFCGCSTRSSTALSPAVNQGSMEVERSPLFSLAYYCQGKSMEELRDCLLYTTLELEKTKLAVEEELKKSNDQLVHLRQLLERAINERDEAQDRCQRLLLENLILQQQEQLRSVHPLSGVSSINEEELRREKDPNNGFSSSDCEESIVSPSSTQLASQLSNLDSILPDKPLPEKGKLLQAVMKAGPLLQTLLLAGPLPQWRHPPPPMESSEIPPVKIPSPPPPPPPPLPPVFLQDALLSTSGVCGKRSAPEGFDSPTQTKYQRPLLLN